MNPTTPQFDPPTLLFSDPINSVATGASTFSELTAARLVHQQRLVEVLRGTVEGFDLLAAELHLLDDASEQLNVVADYGDRPASGPRPLESASADLAALAGGVVVLEDQEMVAEWNVAYPCRAAICMPVASDITIHGTLWLYGALPREFTDAEIQLMEIVAGRLAVEIERRQLLLG